MKVHENVNWDYPQCGGHIIREYKNKWCITLLSNYQSSRTNVKLTVSKSTHKTLDSIKILLDNPYLADDYITNKGYIVQ